MIRLLAFLGLTISLATAESQPLNLSLPTDNTAIFDGEPEDFYMWVPRIFEISNASETSLGVSGRRGGI